MRWQRCFSVYIRAWSELKANAQRLQDAGFFAPRPRARRRPAQELPNSSPLAGRFEDKFQRLKRAAIKAR